MKNAKLYAILLSSMTLVGIVALSPLVSTLMNKVIIIKTTGTISTTEVTAESGSPEDIQVAVDAVYAAGGGTVYVPEGNFSFAIDPNKLSPDARGPMGVIVPGGVNVIGMGEDKTILYQPSPAPTESMMFWLDGKNNRRIRISGITFKGYMETESNPIRGLRVEGCTDFRIDHCKFVDFGGSSIWVNNRFYRRVSRGVIDHVEIDNPYKDIIGGIWAYGITVSGDGVTWNPIDYYLGQYDGKNNIVYIEDCTFKRCRHAIASNSGAFYVARHCTFSENRPRHYGMVDVHGVSPAGRGLEAYDNLLLGTYYQGYYPAHGFWVRGGGGVIFNNEMRDGDTGIRLTAEGVGQEAISQLYIWNNSMVNVEVPLDPNGFVENVDYFLYAKPGYTPYPYPHPLTQG